MVSMWLQSVHVFWMNYGAWGVRILKYISIANSLWGIRCSMIIWYIACGRCFVSQYFCVVHLIAALIVSLPDVAYHLLLVHVNCTLWAFAVADGSYVSKLPIVERYMCC